MFTRHFAPRASSKILFNGSCFAQRRLATGLQSTEAGLEQHFRESAAATQQPVASSDMPSSPRIRRRKKVSKSDTKLAAWHVKQHIKQTTGHFGSKFDPGYQPETVLTNPPTSSQVTLELLLASQAHMGHATALWNPANSRYIFGVRDGIHIISLDVTAQYLRRAAKVVSGVAEHGGIILFVGTRPGFEQTVVKAAELASPAYHLFDRWIPGTLTNGGTILNTCEMKVVDDFDQDMPGFQDQILGLDVLKPDLVVVLNPLENRVLLHECAMHTIPTIGVIDTDADPTSVTYPIPANDDSLRCIQVIAGVLGRAGQEGQLKRLRAAVQGRKTTVPDARFTLPSDFNMKEWQALRDAKRDAMAEYLGMPKPSAITNQGATSADPDAVSIDPVVSPAQDGPGGQPQVEPSDAPEPYVANFEPEDTFAKFNIDPETGVDVTADAAVATEQTLEAEAEADDSTSFIERVRAALPPELMEAVRSGATPAQLDQARALLTKEDYETLMAAVEAMRMLR